MAKIGTHKAAKLSAEKARTMLEDGKANGKALTPAQKRYFGWIAGGRKPRKG
jgi:hypothetical protein